MLVVLLAHSLKDCVMLEWDYGRLGDYNSDSDMARKGFGNEFCSAQHTHLLQDRSRTRSTLDFHDVEVMQEPNTLETSINTVISLCFI